MTDKELIELAAKAAGLNIKAERVDVSDRFTHFIVGAKNTRERVDWNPLTDDGDALRLAVKLKLTITQDGDWCDVIYNTDKTRCVATYLYKDADNDPYAATRRAIVRAAAEIGKAGA